MIFRLISIVTLKYEFILILMCIEILIRLLMLSWVIYSIFPENVDKADRLDDVQVKIEKLGRNKQLEKCNRFIC